MATLWMRAETKPFESRAALWPTHARALIDAGHRVIVERSQERCVPEAHYSGTGCLIAKGGSWRDAPAEAVILGLKSLPSEPRPLHHRHIFFAHAYNYSRIFSEKTESLPLLNRFRQGRGEHYDLEFLVDEQSTRVASFGVSAGVAGAAIALLIWSWRSSGSEPPYSLPTSYKSSDEFIEAHLAQIRAFARTPSILVVGAAGRCGRGVTEFLSRCGLRWVSWGRAETGHPQAYREILRHEILINCVQAREDTRTLLTTDQLTANEHLRLIADIGCETSGNNPLPIYRGTTTYANPTHRIDTGPAPIDIVAIDNLPAFFAHESSHRFSSQLLPHLLTLLNLGRHGVWERAYKTFQLNINRLGAFPG